MNNTIRTFAILLAVAALAVPAAAQDLTHKAPPQRDPIAIINATIHPVSSETIESGWILLEDGRIVDMGKGVRGFNRRTKTIDGEGLHVWPGLFGANTVTGLVEINSVRATRDFAETGDITPEVRAAVAVNPDSTIIPVTRANGVLTVGVFPMGGAVPGRASVIRMDGWTWEDLAIDDAAGLVVNWPIVKPIDAWWMDKSDEEQMKEAKENLRKIDEIFDAAEAYVAARAADPSVPVDLRFEAMRTVLEGEDPVLISAQELEQIESAVSWAAARDLKTVIVGGRDADLCTDLLRRHDVSVIVTGTHKLPRSRDAAYDDPFTAPIRLEEAGVTWCLASGGGPFGTAHERNLPYNAATAVAYGLDHAAAIRSITLGPAKIFGVDDEIGSLEKGKAATLIVTTGDPLEITTHVRHAFIDGREIDLSNKQTELAEKYREKYRQLGVTAPSSSGGGATGGAGERE